MSDNVAMVVVCLIIVIGCLVYRLIEAMENY
jgi:hypothetical protein